MLIERAENSLDGRLHIWKQKRIAQRTQTRSQKRFDFFTGRETFAHQQSRNTWRDGLRAVRGQELDATERVPPNWPVAKFFGRRDDPSTLHRLA